MKPIAILLTFLSDVKVAKDGAISDKLCPELGKNCITNESAVRHLIQSGVKLDHIFMYASQKVRDYIYIDWKKTQPYLDESGQKVRHYECFRRRLRDVLPEVDDISEIIDFDESASVGEAMRSVAKVAEKIQQYAQDAEADSSEKNEIILYADCTGGFRYANIIMMAVMRLLEYQGIIVREVFYANIEDEKIKVERIGSIYRMFDMASGAEEFVRFGSVDALVTYFEKGRASDLCPALRQLLETMQAFADEIKLCRYGRLKKIVGDLGVRVEEFETAYSETNTNINDRLMNCLLVRIKNDYAPLIRGTFDDVAAIRWCLAHKYMQQALTLFTERVPEYLGENRIISVTKDYEARLEEKRRKNDREPYFYLLTEMDPDLIAKPAHKAAAEQDEDCSGSLWEKWEAEQNKSMEIQKKKLFNLYKTALEQLTSKKGKFDPEALDRALNTLLLPSPPKAVHAKHADSKKAAIPAPEKLFLGYSRRAEAADLLRFIADHRPPNTAIFGEADNPSLHLQRIFRFFKKWKEALQKDKEKSLQKDKEKTFLVDKIPAAPYDAIKFFFQNCDANTILGLFSDLINYASKLGFLQQEGIIAIHPAVDEKILYSVLNDYSIVKNERNHSNHARSDDWNFDSTEELAAFMTRVLDNMDALGRCVEDSDHFKAAD